MTDKTKNIIENTIFLVIFWSGAAACLIGIILTELAHN